MREIPMLFSGPMVAAILNRQKTVTRRVVKPQPTQSQDGAQWWWDARPGLAKGWRGEACSSADVIELCPHGRPGDLIWVKETWRPSVAHSHGMDACDCGDISIRYEADGAERFVSDRDIPGEWSMPKAARRGNVTPLFMPRWASRITLEVATARVERLHEITEEDARAEGAMSWALESERNQDRWAYWTKRLEPTARVGTARGAFFALWESINGIESIGANPWVRVVNFNVNEVKR